MTQRPEERRGRRWPRLILQLLSLVLFGLLLWWGGAEAWQQVLTGNLRDILIAFLLIGAVSALSALRLRWVACAVAGRNLGSWGQFFYLNMTARAAGLVMPRSLTTFAGKPVALRALGMPIKRAVWAVVLDNLLDLLLLGTWTIPGLIFLQDWMSPATTIVLAAGLTLVLAGGVRWVIAGGRLSRIFSWLERIPRLAAALPIDREAADGALLGHSAVLPALGLSVLINGMLVIVYHTIARAVGLSIPWPVFAASFPVTQLSLVLAVTPGGLGIFDAGWYGLLVLSGVEQQEALNFVIAQRACVFVYVLIWGGLGALLSLLLERGRNARRKEGSHENSDHQL
ncbi:MAG: lysylphosphatidylglycerol synthase transmembrane domain-containing protein [Anaerolineae bacterium]|jgi:uncharacterized protein (TIRG00374 family)